MGLEKTSGGNVSGGPRSLLKFLAVILVGGGGFFLWNRADHSPLQPIAFNHKQHLDKKMPCAFCHSFANRSSAAGMPGVRRCMTCHQSIKSDSPQVQEMRAYFEANEEIPWIERYGFPSDSRVYFSHQRHIAAEIDCVTCHGDVAQATSDLPVIEHTMGWCLECHEQHRSRFSTPELATDCLTCHN